MGEAWRKEQPKEEKPLQKGLTREVLHKESHKTARHNTNKKAKDMDLAPEDKPIKTIWMKFKGHPPPPKKSYILHNERPNKQKQIKQLQTKLEEAKAS